MNTELTMEIASIIVSGRHDELSSSRIAYQIMEHLERKAASQKKPRRGIGAVSQADLLRGL
jgi:hypothetical protein